MKFPSTWTSAELEVADAYGDTLSSLRMNSKPIINTLTELANGYSKEHPKVIVHVIEERIKEVSKYIHLMFRGNFSVIQANPNLTMPIVTLPKALMPRFSSVHCYKVKFAPTYTMYFNIG